MIYMKKRSKKTKRSVITKMTLTDAKLFIYNLSKGRFKLSKYYIAGADRLNEMEDILSFFSPEYITKEESNDFDMYLIKENVPKNNRISGNITPTSILNIQQKVEKEFSEFHVMFSLDDGKYRITLYDDNHKYTFVINDELEIENALIETVIHESALEEHEVVKTRLNKLLIKQRYYYKRKNEWQEQKDN